MGKEWWRTVRYAIGKEGRTVRLISVLVTVGAVVLLLIAVTNGVSVTVGV